MCDVQDGLYTPGKLLPYIFQFMRQDTVCLCSPTIDYKAKFLMQCAFLSRLRTVSYSYCTIRTAQRSSGKHF